jgi:hypothetical protein
MDQAQKQGMDNDSLEAAFAADVDDAASFIDTEISPDRALATQFYRGEPFGDEEQGRSQIVMPVVRDTARATLPSLVRIFMGSQRVVEFDSGAVGKEQFADDATETVNYVLMRQNNGFRILWDAFKDALVRKSGWVKWWWDDSIEVSTKVFSGVSEQQLLAAQDSLEQDEVLEVKEKYEVGQRQSSAQSIDSQTGQPIIDPQTGQPVVQPGPMVPVYEFKIQIVKHCRCNKVRVATLPPEEIIISRDATDEHGARLICHRTTKTRSQLVAMGIPEEALTDVQWDVSTLQTNAERIERMPNGIIKQTLANLTPDQQSCTFYDGYYLVDYDGDGISELRQIWAVGSQKTIVRNEPVDEVPLALFCPDPEPHVVFGLSQADNVMDLQVITSHIFRDMLDSLKASIFPRMAYVEGQANVDDVLNTEIGAAIRMRQPGMVTPLEVPFVGEKAYGMLEMLEGVKEQRTGVSKASLGLDPQALQSTNQVAVTAAVTGAQAQVELIARIFAETGMKRLFRGILRLLTKHQNNKMQFRLNGRLFDVNPADWDPDMDVLVNTALGTGMSQEKLSVLMQVAATQKDAMGLLGIDNPLCSLQEFYNTQRKILQIVGLPDVHRYFRDPAEAIKSGATIKPPSPTPEETISNAQLAIERARLDKDKLVELLKDDRERDKMEIDAFLRAKEIGARYHTTVDLGLLKAVVDRERNHMQHAAATAPVPPAPAEA